MSVELPDHFRELTEMPAGPDLEIPELAKECQVFCRRLEKLLLSVHQLTGLSPVLVSSIYAKVVEQALLFIRQL